MANIIVGGEWGGGAVVGGGCYSVMTEPSIATRRKTTFEAQHLNEKPLT